MAVKYDKILGKVREADSGGGGGPGSDTTAIHVNVSAEISTLTAKTTIADTDVFILESAANSFAKRKISGADIKEQITIGVYKNKGGYNAATNTPDLDTAPSGIKNADAYTVTVAGTFFTEAVEVGDILIANQDDPTTLSQWMRVNKNISFGTTAGTACEGDDGRLSDARTPTAHAATHTNGTDDIQSATAAQKGLATATQITKLDGIEDGADVTDATNVAAAGAVMDSDYTAADVVLVGTGVGTQGAVTLAASEFLAKKATGTATNVTATEARAILNVEDGADVTDATNVAAAGAVMDADYTAADVVLVGTGVGTQGGVTLAASQFLAKKAAGAATNVTAAEARAILNVGDGADLVGPAGAADNGIPVFDGVTGKLLKDSGATIGNGIAGGSLHNMVAYTTDPVSPTAGDSWLLLSGGVLYFKYAVSSSDIRSVVLGEE